MARCTEKPSDNTRASEREEIKKIIENRSTEYSTLNSTYNAFRSKIIKGVMLIGIGGLAWTIARSVDYRKHEVEDARILTLKDRVERDN